MEAALSHSIPPGRETDIRSRIRALAASELRPLVRRIDEQGYYPESVLRGFGAAGAYAEHQSGATKRAAADLGDAIGAMSAVAEECLSTAFCMWCQDALGWYLENTENTSLRDDLQAKVADGSVLGGTGLSNPMKALSGIEPMRLTGQRVDGGWIVNGSLPWVSNLGDHHLFGICFAKEGVQAGIVMALARIGDPGIEGRAQTHFIALEGTATMGAVFKDAFIADHLVLADPAEPMIRRIRPGFVLLQTGMGLGLTGGCLKGLAMLPKGAADFLPDSPDAIRHRLQTLEAQVTMLARTPTEQDRDYLIEVLEARLAVSELALSAAQSAMLGAGARGYILGFAYHRRLREAYFVAIVTPAMKHLRKNIAAMKAPA